MYDSILRSSYYILIKQVTIYPLEINSTKGIFSLVLLNVIFMDISTNYISLLIFLNLETLEQQRLLLDLYFQYKLLAGIVRCGNFLSRHSFKTSVVYQTKCMIYFIRAHKLLIMSITPQKQQTYYDNIKKNLKFTHST